MSQKPRHRGGFTHAEQMFHSPTSVHRRSGVKGNRSLVFKPKDSLARSRPREEPSLHSPHVTNNMLASAPSREVKKSCSILMPGMCAGLQPNRRLQFYTRADCRTRGPRHVRSTEPTPPCYQILLPRLLEPCRGFDARDSTTFCSGF